MKTLKIKIDSSILQEYPDVTIGYSLFQNINLLAEKAPPDQIKLLPAKGILERNLSLQNLTEFSTVFKWRNIYQNCGLKPKTYKSSIEALLRRFLQNDYRNIHNVVDIYNCISAGYLLSMGGYDYSNLHTTLTLRYGRPGDKFIPLNGRDDIKVERNHIVYADENIIDNIVCWMWNYKDSKRTMLTRETGLGLFIIDALGSEERERLFQAQDSLKNTLEGLGAVQVSSGILDKEVSEREIN